MLYSNDYLFFLWNIRQRSREQLHDVCTGVWAYAMENNIDSSSSWIEKSIVQNYGKNNEKIT